MDPAERERFDRLFEEALEQLPPRIHELLAEVPVILEDRPDPELAKRLYHELGHEEGESVEEFAEGLCGLHTGVALTERSVQDAGELPSNIMIFREGVVETAGGWEAGEGETDEEVEDAVFEEIMITLLHEIGHQFGLSERDLEELGYE